MFVNEEVPEHAKTTSRSRLIKSRDQVDNAVWPLFNTKDEPLLNSLTCQEPSTRPKKPLVHLLSTITYTKMLLVPKNMS